MGANFSLFPKKWTEPKKILLHAKSLNGQRIINQYGSVWTVKKEDSQKILAVCASKKRQRYIFKENDSSFYFEYL